MTQATSARPSFVRYWVLGFLCVLAFLTYFDRVCISSAQPDIERDLHISHEQMGVVFGAFWLAYGLFEIPAGAIGDRFGGKRALAVIALVWSLFTALSGAAVGFVSLMTYRILFGVGEAGAYPNMATVQHAWFPPRSHARIGGFLWLVSRWGGALSFVIFPALLTGLDRPGFRHALRSGGMHAIAALPAWRLGFWVCGIAGLVWVVLFVPWFRDDPAEQRHVNAAELQVIRAGREGRPHGHARFDARTFRLLLTSPTLWAIGVAYLGTSFGWSFLVTWMNRFLSDVHHVSYGGSTWLKMLPLFLGGIACLVGGAASDAYVRRTGRRRFGRVIFPVVGATVAAASMACVPLTHSAPQAMTLVCLASVASDMGQAPAWASIIAVGGEYAGTAFGLINMIANCGGNFLAPVVCPRIVHDHGWPAMMLIYAAAFLLAAILWTTIDPSRRFDERRTG